MIKGNDSFTLLSTGKTSPEVVWAVLDPIFQERCAWIGESGEQVKWLRAWDM